MKIKTLHKKANIVGQKIDSLKLKILKIIIFYYKQ